MIVTRTPYRVSFFGGGTDYEAFYSRHGGACLAATIDRYCHVLLRRMPAFLGSKYRVFYAQSDCVDRIEDIRHSGVRGCLQYLGVDDGIEVNHAGDLPARSGLGSSSAFVVGMLRALHALRGEHASSPDLAREAIAVEQGVLKETVGIQDQIQCEFGGLNVIRIERDGGWRVVPAGLTPNLLAAFEDHFLLVFTGIQRVASEIAAEQVRNIDRKESELLAIRDMVQPALDEIRTFDMPRFGAMLHDAWMLKRTLSAKISNPEIDSLYEAARSEGAWGGKVLGAGGGGFMLFCLPPEKRKALAARLGKPALPLKVSFGGSEVVHRTEPVEFL